MKKLAIRSLIGKSSPLKSPFFSLLGQSDLFRDRKETIKNLIHFSADRLSAGAATYFLGKMQLLLGGFTGNKTTTYYHQDHHAKSIFLFLGGEITPK